MEIKVIVTYLAILFLEVNVTSGEPNLEDRILCNSGDVHPSNRVNTTKRVADLRTQMKSYGLQGYIIPDGDAHQSEYIAPHDARRAFISGFTGSEGIAVVLATEQAQWTDGRYFLQADEELDCQWLLMKDGLPDVPSVKEWIKSRLSSGEKVGIDPLLLSADKWLDLSKSFSEIGIETVSNDADGKLIPNLVDKIWETQPPRSSNHTIVLSTDFTGETWQSKVTRVRQALSDEGIDLLVVSALDEVAWLLNVRGDDVPNVPIFYSYVLLSQDEVKLFTPDTKVSTEEVRHHLSIDGCTSASNKLCVQHFFYEDVFDELDRMSQNDSVGRVLIPSTWAYTGGSNYALYNSVSPDKRVSKVSPILFYKAAKNKVESQGMKNAHVRDGVAVISFLAHIENLITSGGSLDELSASHLLADYRRKQKLSRGNSFDTISAFGSNAAIIHYRPSEATNKQITDESLYLLDSGGQYDDGTTDVTRTMHYGKPTDFQIEMYTRVLMGALDLLTLIFPEGTTDTRTDITARRPIYELGLDYRHGTGHGIGMFLYIHESPTQLRIYGTEQHPYHIGYFFSDEPGYYKDGDFGIRLETILTVVKANTTYGLDTNMLTFEPVTLVPFEPKLINHKLLTKKQCEALNSYHQKIRATIGTLLEQQAYDWMMTKTKTLPCVVHV